MSSSYKKLLVFFLSIFITLLHSCKGSHNIEDIELVHEAPITIDVSSKNNNKIKSFSDVFDSLQIISFKSIDTTFFIASLKKIVLYKHDIFALDERFSNLIRFDSMGRYLNKYGKIGLLKNEYEKINDFDIDTTNNRVVIFSSSDKSLYYYNLKTGGFLKKVNIGLYGSNFCLTQNSQILLYRNFSVGGMKENTNLVLLDSTGHVLKKRFPFNFDISKIEWQSTGFLRSTNGLIIHSNAYSDTVYKYDKNYLKEVLEIKITSNEVKKNKFNHEKLLMNKILLDSTASFLGADFFMNDNFIVFNYQQTKKIKNSIYYIQNNTQTTISNNANENPFTLLGLTPIYIDKTNTVFFKLTMKDILNAKKKNPKIFETLSKTNQAILTNPKEKSGVFMLKVKIRLT